MVDTCRALYFADESKNDPLSFAKNTETTHNKQTNERKQKLQRKRVKIRWKNEWIENMRFINRNKIHF